MLGKQNDFCSAPADGMRSETCLGKTGTSLIAVQTHSIFTPPEVVSVSLAEPCRLVRQRFNQENKLKSLPATVDTSEFREIQQSAV